jgi:hypothetical protein
VFAQGMKTQPAISEGRKPTPATSLLQPKCACGGSCAKCSKQFDRNITATHQSRQRSHDFSRLRLFPSSRPAMPPFAVNATHQPAEEETEKEQYSPEGVRMTLAGSGTCVNGGAASACNPATGVYVINSNNNTCCTKPCSQQHEQTHVNDVTGWGCCTALSAAYNRPGADRNAAVQKYNTWLAAVYDITECNSLTSDVACADQMLTAKDCNGAGRNTDCCKDIVDYKANFGAQKATVCGRAPRTVAPCPAF